MGLTLISAGWVLIWEFTRFLHCAYAVQGKVVSLEPGYSLNGSGAQPGRKFYFFPVIEYYWSGQNIRFTSLDENYIDSLQVGDQVQLSFSRSRRKHTRFGRFMTLMMSCMAILIAVGVMGGVQALGEEVALVDILLASMVLAVCLFIIVLYMRQLDETMVDSEHHARRRSVLTCVFLQEPTNVCYWKKLFTNRKQRRRIWVSKMLGSSCLVAGFVMFVFALYPGGSSLEAAQDEQSAIQQTTTGQTVQRALVRD